MNLVDVSQISGILNDKVKASLSDSTADYLESKIAGSYTIDAAIDTVSPGQVIVLNALVSRYDNVGVTQNYSSGSDQTLGGFNNVGSQGSENTAIGVDVFNVGATLTKSVGVGNNIAKTLVTAQQITAIGQGALQNLTTAGDEQVAVGSGALGTNSGNLGGAFTGDFNVSIGTDTLALLDGGYRNTALGHNAGGAVTTGSRNTIIGYEAGLSLLTNITSGSDNIAIGVDADSDGDLNLIIGNGASSQLGASSANQNTVIGHGANVNASGQIAIGYGSSIINGGQDTLIGINSTIDASGFPTFSSLNTQIGSSSNTVGFYNQNLGYNNSITGDDNCVFGNYNATVGNDNVLIGNGLGATATGSYVIGVDSSNGVDYSFQASWNDGTTQFDNIRLVSQANINAALESWIQVTGSLDLAAPGNVTISKGNLKVYKQLSQKMEFQGTLTSTPQVLDWNLGNMKSFVLGNNITLSNTVNIEAGIYYLIIAQDAVGGRTITWGTQFKWAGGVIPILSSAPNEIDAFTFISNGTDLLGTWRTNFS